MDLNARLIEILNALRAVVPEPPMTAGEEEQLLNTYKKTGVA